MVVGIRFFPQYLSISQFLWLFCPLDIDHFPVKIKIAWSSWSHQSIRAVFILMTLDVEACGPPAWRMWPPVHCKCSVSQGVGTSLGRSLTKVDSTDVNLDPWVSYFRPWCMGTFEAPLDECGWRAWSGAGLTLEEMRLKLCWALLLLDVMVHDHQKPASGTLWCCSFIVQAGSPAFVVSFVFSQPGTC